jgi:hypothetical protein
MKTDYSNIGSVCFDCAKKAGFKFNKVAASVWTGECGICHKQKPCTNLHRDWIKTKKKQERN